MPVRRKYRQFTEQCMFCDLVMKGPHALQGKRLSQYEVFDRVENTSHKTCPECNADARVHGWGYPYHKHIRERIKRDRDYARAHPEHAQAIENTAAAIEREEADYEAKRLKKDEGA